MSDIVVTDASDSATPTRAEFSEAELRASVRAELIEALNDPMFLVKALTRALEAQAFGRLSERHAAKGG